MQLSTGRRSPRTGRREDGTSRPPHAAEGPPQARALHIAHGPEVLAALAEPDAPHSRKAAAAAERHDLTLMQPLFPEPAFDEYSVTLARLDFLCATSENPELWTLGFLQPSGLRSLPVCLWKVEVLHDSFCSLPTFLHCCGRNCPVAPHWERPHRNKFCVRPHFTPPDSVNQGRQVFTPTSGFRGLH